MNKIVICGRLTRDPEITQGANKSVAKYSVAVDRKIKQDGHPEADFFNCVAFGKTAEFAEKYLKKGTKMLIAGRIECEPYTNKDGKKQYPWTLIVEEQEFAEGKKAAEENQGSEVKTDSNGYVDISDGIVEDLPFI